MTRCAHALSRGGVECTVWTIERYGLRRTYYQVAAPPLGALVDTPEAAARALREAAQAMRALAEQADELAGVVELESA